MISIQGRGCSRRERTSKDPLQSLSPPECSHDEIPVNPLGVEPPIAMYTKKDLQKIFRTVFKAGALPFDGLCEKPLKARLPDVNCGKLYKECYNFCQQCEDHFATAGVKDLNHILFAAFFLRDSINFRWQQYKRKHEAESSLFITKEEFKPFFCQSLRYSQAFINSY